ncbi:PadR family transcriptional regulator [Spirosoma terrae]|uniref:PadR family transcriptional regulator n=1 Tax=Spirosoma terrae TaxID=1968276 RepID=A0A6L9LEE7_9BACT|nr:PadR family transcriptional regulator [Spirosoma terrae]NDU97742.1 PadR family transcriptional regulator [Spirosoma terrae]
MNTTSHQLLKGSLSAIILKLLAHTEWMYGYEICQKVKQLTDGQLKITEGALYPALYKLEADGMLITKTQIVEGRARKYYAIAQDQQGNAVDRLAQIEQFLHQLQRILTPSDLSKLPTT